MRQSLSWERKFVTVAQMVKKFKPIKKHEGYYRVHKIPTLVSILNQLSSIHALLFNFLKGTLQYYSVIKSSLLQVVAFLQVFTQQEWVHLYSVLYVLHVLPISSSFDHCNKFGKEQPTHYIVPHYVTGCSLLLPPVSYVQIFSFTLGLIDTFI